MIDVAPVISVKHERFCIDAIDVMFLLANEFSEQGFGVYDKIWQLVQCAGHRGLLEKFRIGGFIYRFYSTTKTFAAKKGFESGPKSCFGPHIVVFTAQATPPQIDIAFSLQALAPARGHVGDSLGGSAE